jgi:hypothetical protein
MLFLLRNNFFVVIIGAYIGISNVINVPIYNSLFNYAKKATLVIMCAIFIYLIIKKISRIKYKPLFIFLCLFFLGLISFLPTIFTTTSNIQAIERFFLEFTSPLFFLIGFYLLTLHDCHMARKSLIFSVFVFTVVQLISISLVYYHPMLLTEFLDQSSLTQRPFFLAGFSGSRTGWAMWTVLFFPIAYIAMFENRKLKLSLNIKTVFLIFFIICLVSVGSFGARGGVLAFLAAMPLIIWHFGSLVYIISFLIMFAILIIMFFLSDVGLVILDSIRQDVRGPLLIEGLQLFYDQPILGLGLDSINNSLIGSARAVHFTWIRILLEGGILGGVLILSAMLSLGVHILKSRVKSIKEAELKFAILLMFFLSLLLSAIEPVIFFGVLNANLPIWILLGYYFARLRIP